MIKVLFICHGNICRSPMAEFVMKKLLADNNIHNVEVSSAAVSSEEQGNDIYPPAKSVMRANDIPFSRHYAHRVTDSEFEDADVVYVMDNSNYQLLKKRFYSNSQKIHMLLNHDVADPWYSGDFEKTYQEIAEGCTKIINGLAKNYGVFSLQS